MIGLVLMLMLQQSPASAVAAKADAAITRADFNAALTMLNAVTGGTPDEMVRVHLLRAECLMALQRTSEADGAYAEAIKLNPAVNLAPGASLKLSNELERVKSKMVGTLALKSNVNGAMALLDGKSVGPLPIEVPLVAGRHQVKIASDDTAVLREIEVFPSRKSELGLDVAQSTPAVTAEPPPFRVVERPSRALPFTLIAFGAVAAVAGAVLWGVALSWNSVDKTQLEIGDAVAQYEAAKTRLVAGIVTLAVGAALAIAGIAVLLQSSEGPQVAWFGSWVEGGPVAGLGGRF